MADKPYRVYRGGRSKGKVPLPGRPERPAREQKPGQDGRGGPSDPKQQRAQRPRRKRAWTWRRWIALVLVTLFVLFVVWAVASYLALRGGVASANKRVKPSTKAALAHQGGLLLSTPTTILLLGTDHANTDARAADNHSDSIMLVHTDPSRHRIAYLSIPRDLRVPIPGLGDEKINAAFQNGGPPLAIRTIENFTGLKINHIVLVDFGAFQDLIDELGGVTIDVPKRIVSDRFDCPYGSAARCQQWEGWRFAKGPQHMDGRRALIYSRVRVNRLDPSESDVTRGERQQAVLQAMTGRLSSFGTMLRMPFVGGDVVQPLATDLSTGQLLQLGWVKFRSGTSRALHCRLGGSAATVGNASVIVSSPENISVIHMVLGNSAPQPPSPGSGPYGPGCVTGSQSLH